MLAAETVERVRAEVDIVSVVGDTVRLTKRGRSWVGLCPFHKEKSPSFHVSEERGFYHCFGCQASGDALRFVMETEGLSFVEAVRRLAERQGIPVLEDRADPESRARDEARRRQEELLSALEVAAAWFERMLREHPLRVYAETELERRGLGVTGKGGAPDPAVAQALQAFRVGYAPWGWDGLAQHLKGAGVSAMVAEAVGLLAPRKTGVGHYDRFRHRLMFAVTDLQGRVVAFSGRALPDPGEQECRVLGLPPPRAEGGEAPAKYINSPESPVYRKREAVFGLHQARQAVRTEQECVLVEGNFDVVSLHARGVCNVVAPLGTAFTPEQARLVRRFCGRVVVLFDGDSAGQRATAAAREPCREAGLTPRVATLPPGVDPDDLARREGAAGVLRVVRAARGMLEFLIDTALDDLPEDAQSRGARLRELAALIASEPDPAVRSLAEAHADRVVARISGGSERSFRELSLAIRRELSDRGGSERAPTARVEPPSRARARDLREEIGWTVVGAVLDFPDLLDDPEVGAGVEALEGDPAAAVAALRYALRQGPLPTPEVLLAKLPRSINTFAAARLAAPRHEQRDDARQELLENVQKLKRLELKRRESEVVEDLHRAASQGDFDRELALLGEQLRRAQQRHGLVPASPGESGPQEGVKR